jgi:hypothetical protein
MAAGVIWITSGGDSGKVGQAKKMIVGSLTGIIILACSWLILNTINPKLVSLQTLDMKISGGAYETYLVCCDPKIGENSVKVKVVDGEYYYAEGTLMGKKAGCFGSVCGDGYKCLETNTTEKAYACFEDVGCCECHYSILSVPAAPECRNSVYYDNCASVCKNIKKGFDVSYIYYDSSTHTCGPDNRCIPR